METGQQKPNYGKLENIQYEINRMRGELSNPQFQAFLDEIQRQLEEEYAQAGELSARLFSQYNLYSKQQESNTPQGNSNPQPAYQQTAQFVPQKKKDMEFQVGARIFGGIGALFVLASLIMLGVVYMNGVVRDTIVSVIAVVFAGSMLALGCKKDNLVLRSLSFLGPCICFPFLSGENLPIFFWVMLVLSFVINLVAIVLPYKKPGMIPFVLQMICNSLFVCWMLFFGNWHDVVIVAQIVFALSQIVILHLCYGKLEKEIQKAESQGMRCDKIGYLIAFGLALFLEMSMTVFFLWLYVFGGGSENLILGILLAVFVLIKLASRVKVLRIAEIYITLLTCMVGIPYFYQGTWFGVGVAVAFFLSILMLHRDKVFYQGIITFVLLLFCTARVGSISLLPVLNVGILFLLFLLFNHVKLFGSAKQKWYNYGNLVVMALWTLRAAGTRDGMNCLLLGVLGTVIILLLFQKQYGIEEKGKYWCLALLWSYLVLISPMPSSLHTSALLLLVSMGSVAIGFVKRQKSVRIYGLVLAVLTCLKVFFYDFAGVPFLEKAVLIFVMGILILVISAIYGFLEKKLQKGEE